MTDDLGGYAVEALRHAGLIDNEASVQFEPLDGGVSNDVVLVRVGAKGFVAKRALARLRVVEQWDASVARSFTEATALQWARTVNPDAVPEVLAIDRENNVIVETLAPADYFNWKTVLLAGSVTPGIGHRLGNLLSSWHRASTNDRDLLALFASREAFGQLRVHPFYEVAAERNPSVADRLHSLVERMDKQRRVLVHGDFSPKNMLVTTEGALGVWVIDWEVAHTGDPVFDLAFLLHHLLCKAIARPRLRVELERTADDFLGGYEHGIGDSLDRIDPSYLAAHTAALLLARVDGKSPVEYFDERQKTVARTIAVAGLESESPRVSSLWRMLNEH